MEELTLKALEANDNAPKPKEPYELIREHLDEKGIKRTWFAEKMFRSKQWVTGMLNGDIPLTEENRLKAEKVLDIKL